MIVLVSNYSPPSSLIVGGKPVSLIPTKSTDAYLGSQLRLKTISTKQNGIPQEITKKIQKILAGVGGMLHTLDIIRGQEKSKKSFNLLGATINQSQKDYFKKDFYDSEFRGNYLPWLLTDTLFHANAFFQIHDYERGNFCLQAAENLFECISKKGAAGLVTANMMARVPMNLHWSNFSDIKGAIDFIIDQTNSAMTEIQGFYPEILLRLNTPFSENPPKELIPELQSVNYGMMPENVLQEDYRHLTSTWSPNALLDFNELNASVEKQLDHACSKIPFGDAIILGGGSGHDAFRLAKRKKLFNRVLSVDHSAVATVRTKNFYRRFGKILQLAPIAPICDSALKYAYKPHSANLIFMHNFIGFLSKEERQQLSALIQKTLMVGGKAVIIINGQLNTESAEQSFAEEKKLELELKENGFKEENGYTLENLEDNKGPNNLRVIRLEITKIRA